MARGECGEVVVVPAAHDRGDGRARGEAGVEHEELAPRQPRVRQRQPPERVVDVDVHARVVAALKGGGRGAGEWRRSHGDEPPPNVFNNSQDEVDRPEVGQRARQRGRERREVLLVARAVGERNVDICRRFSRREVARGVDVEDARAGAAREQRGGAVALVDLRMWARARAR